MKKVNLIEETMFDTVETAQREMKFAKINLIRILIGAAFAVLSAILLLIALIGKDSQYYMFAALPAIPAYRSAAESERQSKPLGRSPRQAGI